MWQDGIALLIVAIAVLALLRIYAPRRIFGFDARRSGDGSIKSHAPVDGCSGCALGASCFKAQVKSGA